MQKNQEYKGGKDYKFSRANLIAPSTGFLVRGLKLLLALKNTPNKNKIKFFIFLC
jgi:hypothetical protein